MQRMTFNKNLQRVRKRLVMGIFVKFQQVRENFRKENVLPGAAITHRKLKS